MFPGPVNPNSVHIPLVQTGCLKSQFDSTYPIHLNGIITQDEFQESMNNINRTISSRISVIFLAIISILCIVGGITLFIVGGITTVNSRTVGFPRLVGIGFGLLGCGMLLLFFGCCFVQNRRSTRMRRAIANESMKYSTRSLTPCSWRLDVTRTWVGGYGNNGGTRVNYRLIIEIGNSGASGSGNVQYQMNQFAPQSNSVFPQPYNMPSAPYYGQSATGFCSRCGMPRQNLTTHFCSSCGQPYNI